MTNNDLPFQQKIEKPWGYEIIYTPDNLEYTGKILMIKAGKKLSLQYHDQKIETLCLYSGKALLWLELEGHLEKIPMESQQGYTININQKHRLEALEDSVILESSLPETGTTFRVEDDYHRGDETESLRQAPQRGWNN